MNVEDMSSCHTAPSLLRELTVRGDTICCWLSCVVLFGDCADSPGGTSSAGKLWLQ